MGYDLVHGRVIIVVGRECFLPLFHMEAFISHSFCFGDWSGSQVSYNKRGEKGSKRRLLRLEFLLRFPEMEMFSFPLQGEGEWRTTAKSGPPFMLFLLFRVESLPHCVLWNLQSSLLPGILWHARDTQIHKSGLVYPSEKSTCLTNLVARVFNFCVL